MWISKRINAERDDSADAADFGEVTIGGESAIGVMTDCELRGVGLSAPGGYYWRPRAGQSLLILKCGDGGRVAVGQELEDFPITLRSGEVYITSDGDAAMHLRSDGCVDIRGTLLNNGAPLADGSESEA